MVINKDGIIEEDKKLAISILNKLRSGSRVIGNPAEGLKITLKKLDEQSKIKDASFIFDNLKRDMPLYTDLYLYTVVFLLVK